MLDFPASPSVGQKYPASPLAGIPTYTWDGEKWTTQGGSIVSASPGTLLPLMNAKPALVGVSTNFSREDHVHPVDTSRAPFDAMAYSGLQINGGMEVSQENGTGNVALANSFKYVTDGWSAAMLGIGLTANVSQVLGTPPPGFLNSLGFQATVATPNSGSSDGQYIFQIIEGFRWVHLGFGMASPQPVTISFWVIPNVSGTMAVSIRSSDSARSYVVDVPVTAGVWQYRTVTVPGDTTGAWGGGNTAGSTISFCFGAGSGRKGVANAWQVANVVASAATTNFFSAGAGAVYLTGVTVHPGNEAPSAARSPFVMRPYDQELVTCKRYWSQENIYLTSYQVAAGNAYGLRVPFSVEKRVSPTITQQAQAAANFTWAAWLANARTVGVVGAAGVTGVCTIDYVVNCDARL